MFHLKRVHEQVNVFNVVINIFSNFILDKTMEIDDRDPPWINDFIKNKIKQKNKAFRLFNLSYSCQSVVKNLKELILV